MLNQQNINSRHDQRNRSHNFNKHLRQKVNIIKLLSINKHNSLLNAIEQRTCKIYLSAAGVNLPNNNLFKQQ